MKIKELIIIYIIIIYVNEKKIYSNIIHVWGLPPQKNKCSMKEDYCGSGLICNPWIECPTWYWPHWMRKDCFESNKIFQCKIKKGHHCEINKKSALCENDSECLQNKCKQIQLEKGKCIFNRHCKKNEYCHKNFCYLKKLKNENCTRNDECLNNAICIGIYPLLKCGKQK